MRCEENLFFWFARMGWKMFMVCRVHCWQTLTLVALTSMRRNWKVCVWVRIYVGKERKVLGLHCRCSRWKKVSRTVVVGRVERGKHLLRRYVNLRLQNGGRANEIFISLQSLNYHLHYTVQFWWRLKDELLHVNKLQFDTFNGFRFARQLARTFHDAIADQNRESFRTKIHFYSWYRATRKNNRHEVICLCGWIRCSCWATLWFSLCLLNHWIFCMLSVGSDFINQSRKSRFKIKIQWFQC